VIGALHMSKRVLLALIGVLGVGCADTHVPSHPSADATARICVSSVEVRPLTATLRIGDTARFQVAACGVTGWRWRATDTLVAIVLDSTGGLVQARGAGTTTLIARALVDSTVRGAALITGIK
jgi:hypothetical protein